MLEENLQVTRKVFAVKPCNPASFDGSMLDIMSLHIPMRQGLRGRVASSCVILLGFPIFWVPKNCHLWWGDLILLQSIQGEGEIHLQDATRDLVRRLL